MSIGTNAATLLRRTGRSTPGGDRAFRALAAGAGIFVLVLLAAIATFLVIRALPAFSHDTTSFWTTKTWLTETARPAYGVAAIAFGTVESAIIALVIAWPIALGVAVFVTEYAPRRLSQGLGYAIDTLAAVPSVVYGLWGLYWLVPHMAGVQGWLGRNVGFVPLFKTRYAGIPTKSMFVAGVVLAIMILPIIAAIMREVIRQADPTHKEAALALGATKLEMLRMAVLPPSRSGIVGATILGLGRALGETIAVALVLGQSFIINWHVLEPGGSTIAANIATQFGEAGTVGRPALIASGLVLFAITLLVNLIARAIIYRAAKIERAT
ncbi:MAG: phosphate ABC transporter permease subunit PstC [Frankiaceae bacterium]